jgi:hypothetical protein
MGRASGLETASILHQTPAGRPQETDGGPGRRRRGRRAGEQEVTARIHRASPGASQKERRGSWAAAYLPAPTRSAADAALALRPAPAVTAGARYRPPSQQPEGRSASARQRARRPPGRQSWSDRAAQGRPARPMGPLVNVLDDSTEKQNKPIERE